MCTRSQVRRGVVAYLGSAPGNSIWYRTLPFNRTVVTRPYTVR